MKETMIGSFFTANERLIIGLTCSRALKSLYPDALLKCFDKAPDPVKATRYHCF